MFWAAFEPRYAYHPPKRLSEMLPTRAERLANTDRLSCRRKRWKCLATSSGPNALTSNACRSDSGWTWSSFFSGLKSASVQHARDIEDEQQLLGIASHGFGGCRDRVLVLHVELEDTKPFGLLRRQGHELRGVCRTSACRDDTTAGLVPQQLMDELQAYSAAGSLNERTAIELHLWTPVDLSDPVPRLPRPGRLQSIASADPRGRLASTLTEKRHSKPTCLGFVHIFA